MHRHVDKIRVPVRIARMGAAPETGSFALAPYAEMHTGPETLLERLNAPTRVVPFMPDDGSVVLLLMRELIEWVDADAGVDPALVRPATYRATSEELVQVRMSDGSTFVGVLAIEMPDEFNRASDYLNGDEAFFPLRMRDGTRLVSKRHVSDVRVHAAVRARRAA